MVEHNLLQVGFHLLHLPQDHASLPLDFRLAQLRVLDDVGQNFQRFGHILRQTLGIIHRLLPAGVRVQLRPQVFYLYLQLALRTLLRALEGNKLLRSIRSRPLRLYLEGHVFHEMGDAVVLGILIPAPGVDPDADGGRLRAPILGGDAETFGSNAIAEHFRKNKRHPPEFRAVTFVGGTFRRISFGSADDDAFLSCFVACCNAKLSGNSKPCGFVLRNL